MNSHSIQRRSRSLSLVTNKQQWVLSVRRDPRGRPCLDQLYTNGNSWFTQTTKQRVHDKDGTTVEFVEKTKNLLHPVGRLDYDSTGLLLFSSSGPLTQTLLHPKHAIEKEYVATVTGAVNEDELRATLQAGVKTGEGVHTANLLSVQHMPDSEVAPYLQAIRAELPPEYNQTDLQIRGYLDVLDAAQLSTVTLTVSEGKHRMVRRVLANAGHPVVSLHRARLGAIELGNLPVGATRELTAEETLWARRQLYKQQQAKREAFRKEVKEDAAAARHGGDNGDDESGDDYDSEFDGDTTDDENDYDDER